MKYFKTYSIFLFFLILCGCSSKGSETANANLQNSTNSNTAAATNIAQANSSSTVAGNESVQVVQNIDPNAFNANPKTNVRVVPVDPKDDKNKSGVTGRTAPDNSLVTSTMDAKGMPIEVRTFINNPYLIKVERIFTNPKTIKIHLKNGKVVEVSEDKLPNFTAASPGNILIAAGVDLNKIAEQNRSKTEIIEKKQ